ncbi:MAG: thioredoxin domain-containing protein [Caulobacter sp.]|nr:thioredoxin domain-containing protein [Caulobacter sp.]
MALMFSRPLMAALAALVLLAPAGMTAPALAQPVPAPEPPSSPRIPVFTDGVSLGEAKAPVTLQVYLSYGCPHCRAWFHEVFPVLKSRYVDTGKVRLVVVEFIAGHEAMARAGAIAARCAPPKKYFQVAAALYDHPAKALGGMDENDQPRADTDSWVAEAYKAAGIDPRILERCDRQAQGAALDARMERAMAEYPGYRGGTPAFVANGEEVEAGTLDWAEYAIAVTSREAGHPLTTPTAYDLFCVGALKAGFGVEPEFFETRWSFDGDLWRLAAAPADVKGKPIEHRPGGMALNDGKRDFLLGDDGIPRLASPAPGEQFDGRCGVAPLTPFPK